MQERGRLTPPTKRKAAGGGGSCPCQQTRMPYRIGSRAKIAEIVKGKTPNSRLIKSDGLQGGAAHAPARLRAAGGVGSRPHQLRAAGGAAHAPTQLREAGGAAHVPAHGSRPCQTKATGRPTTSTRGAGCGRSRRRPSPHRRCWRRGGSPQRSIMGCGGGVSCPPPL